jgi:hypothetical protein
LVAAVSSSGVRRAAVVARHPATLKYVAQALGVAQLSSRQAIGPSFLPRSGPREFEVVLLDLDIDPGTPAPELCAPVAAACQDTPIVALAGINARHRLVQALSHEAVVAIVPKLGGWMESGATTEPDGKAEGKPELKLEGPDEQLLGVALRRRADGALQPLGPAPYLLGGTTIEERLIGGSADKDEALAELLADAARLGLSDEKVRRIETAADELLLNAVYDAPRAEDGTPLHADTDRRPPVTLGAQAQVRVRWGCDGRTFAVSVVDRFGALTRAVVTASLQRLLGGSVAGVAGARSPRLARSGPLATGGGAGLGLVLAYSAANELAIHIAPGRFTEATAALQVAGSNRAAASRGSALHLFGLT